MQITETLAIDYAKAQFEGCKFDVSGIRPYSIDGTDVIEVSAYITGIFDGKDGYDYPIAMDVWIEGGKPYGEW